MFEAKMYPLTGEHLPTLPGIQIYLSYGYYVPTPTAAIRQKTKTSTGM
jgi:hypothetical protein